MGDKKKKKAAGDETDDSTNQLSKIYKKRCEANGVQPQILFQSKLNSAMEAGEDIAQVRAEQY